MKKNNLILVLLFLLPTQVWAVDPIFTAVNGSIAGTFPAGSAVKLRTVLTANIDGGSVNVDLVITDSAGKLVKENLIFGQPVSTTARSFSATYSVPSTLPYGLYKFSTWVWAGNWSKTYHVDQTSVQFYAGTPSVIYSMKSSSGDNQGCTINAALKQPMVVNIVDQTTGKALSNVTIDWSTTGGTLSAASSASDASGNASINLTCGSAPQSNTIIAKIHGTTTSVSFVQTSHIPLYAPDLQALPSTVPRLKPNGAGDPLAGTGFIPDTGESFTMVSSLSDEFNEANLDTTKWYTRYIYNDGTLNYFNDECERYNESNTHIMENGSLKLTARIKPGTTCHAPSSTGITYSLYDSGMIRSKTTFKYGYFEARVKLPAGKGVWPAFWINPEVSWPPEIDIFEYVRNDVTEFPNMIHAGVVSRVSPSPQGIANVYNDPNTNTQWGFWKAPSTFLSNYMPADYHVISCFWNQDDIITMYVDGIPVHSFHYKWVHNDGTDGGYAHLLLNLAMGGSWAAYNFTSAISTDQQQFEIDYVRVFQKTNAGVLNKTTIGHDLCPATGC